MSESPLEIFRRQFPAIVRLVDDSEYHVEITLPYDAIGIGSAATVIIKHRNGRGFGCSWQIDRGLLHGLRSRRYDASKPDDAPGNSDWLAELARRLSTDGATNAEVYGSISHKWKASRHHVRSALHRRAF